MRTVILSLFILFVQLSALAADGKWVLEKDNLNIQVYTRTKEHSDIKEFKVLTTINTSRTLIEKILIDINNFKNWFPDIIESKILEKIGPNEYFIYYSVDIPWPADNRDATFRMKIVHNEDKGQTTIFHSTVTGVKAESDDYVRMKKGKGFWKLTDSGPATKVHYQFHSDPGGSLPTWMINMFIVDNPYETVLALKHRADKLSQQ